MNSVKVRLASCNPRESGYLSNINTHVQCVKLRYTEKTLVLVIILLFISSFIIHVLYFTRPYEYKRKTWKGEMIKNMLKEGKRESSSSTDEGRSAG